MDIYRKVKLNRIVILWFEKIDGFGGGCLGNF